MKLIVPQSKQRTGHPAYVFKPLNVQSTSKQGGRIIRPTTAMFALVLVDAKIVAPYIVAPFLRGFKAASNNPLKLKVKYRFISRFSKYDPNATLVDWILDNLKVKTLFEAYAQNNVDPLSMPQGFKTLMDNYVEVQHLLPAVAGVDATFIKELYDDSQIHFTENRAKDPINAVPYTIVWVNTRSKRINAEADLQNEFDRLCKGSYSAHYNVAVFHKYQSNRHYLPFYKVLQKRYNDDRCNLWRNYWGKDLVTFTPGDVINSTAVLGTTSVRYIVNGIEYYVVRRRSTFVAEYPIELTLAWLLGYATRLYYDRYNAAELKPAVDAATVEAKNRGI